MAISFGVTFYVLPKTDKKVAKSVRTESSKSTDFKLVAEKPVIVDPEPAQEVVEDRVAVQIVEEVKPAEQPISPDEFFSYFYPLIAEKHTRVGLMTEIAMYNSIHRVYEKDSSLFLPSRVNYIVDRCLAELEQMRQSDIKAYLFECGL